MESSVMLLSDSAVASNGYSASHFEQGSSKLEPFSPNTSSTPSAAPEAAKPSASPEQAAQLRALLASHLSGNGSANGLGTEHPPLEALLDVLYSMTVTTEDKASTPGPAAVEPVISNLAAPAPPLADMPVMEPEAAPVMEMTHVAESISTPRIAEEQSVEAISGAPDTSATQSAPQNSAPDVLQDSDSEVSATNSAPIERAINSEPVESVANSEPVSVVESRETTQPTPEPMMVETPPAPPVAEIIPTPSVETEESEVVANSALPMETLIAPDPAIAITEGALEGELSELEDASVSAALPVEMPLPIVVQDSTNKVTFSLTTAKTNASLQIPVLPNLSLLVLEQRAEEIIIKIHLAV